MAKDEMILYRKVRDYGSCSCMASLFLVTVLFMIIVSYFSEEKGALQISLYTAAALIFILVVIKLLAYAGEREEKSVLLSVSGEGLHYYGHTTLIQWKVITDIQIIDRQLSVSVGTSPALDFTLNLLDTDLLETFDDFCQLLDRYYAPRKIYLYETLVSCGC
jgi:hypothetical protein